MYAVLPSPATINILIKKYELGAFILLLNQNFADKLKSHSYKELPVVRFDAMMMYTFYSLNEM